MEGRISGVHRHSLAAGYGIRPGEILRSVNGQAVKDIIDLSFLAADWQVEL